MAFVGISKDFKDRVAYKINRMHKAELQSIGPEPKITLSPNAPVALNLIWGEHVHLKDVIPQSWTGKEDNLAMKFVFREGENEHNYTFDVRTTEEFRTPPNYYRYNYKEVPFGVPELKDIEEWVIKKREIDVRWHSVNVKIMEFLNSCKSANEAVKLWPDVKMYFADEDIERLERKTERAGSSTSSAAQVLNKLDTAELASAAVIARLSGAQV